MTKQATNDELAAMIKKGFDGVDKKFKEAPAERNELERDMKEVKMKFAYTAWQIDMEELKKQVVVFEQKVKIKK